MALTWPAVKDPDEVKDYRFDWASILGDDDTISTSDWSISTGSGLTIDTETTDGTETVVWLSDGTDGTTYTLLNRITTTGGRTYDQSARLKCRSK